MSGNPKGEKAPQKQFATKASKKEKNRSSTWELWHFERSIGVRKSTKLPIGKIPFQRLIWEVAQELKTDL